MNYEARYKIVESICESGSLETAASRVLSVYRDELGCIDCAVIHDGEQIAGLSNQDYTKLTLEPPTRFEVDQLWIHCTKFVVGKIVIVSEEKLSVETLQEIHTVSTPLVESFGDPAVAYNDNTVLAANDAYRRLFPLGEVLTATDGGITTQNGRTFSFHEIMQTPEERLGVFVDITAETQRERTLERFYGEINRLFSARTRRAVIRHAMRLAEELLGAGYGVVYLYDEVEGLKVIDRCFRVGDTDGELARKAYQTQERQTDDGHDYYPLGNHGVVILDSRTEFSHVLAVITEAALDKTRREQGLFYAQVIARRVLESNSIDRIPTLVENSIEELFRVANVEAIPYAETDGIAEFDTDNIVVPVGDWGAIVLHPNSPTGFPQVDRRTFSTLGENLATAIQLVEYRQELDILNQVMSRVLRHNLRNELTVLAGHAENTDDQTLREKVDDLEAICEYAREMQNIVKNRNNVKSIRVGDCVARVAEEFDVAVTIEDNPERKMNVYLENAVEHLIVNAVEHGESPVEVRVTAEEITISDDGPGVPSCEVEPIKKHGESALEHGSGLGLWIADRVAAYSDAELQFDGSSVKIAF